MIERLLAADAALARGDLDTAEKLYASVAEADPRNAIAAVGMGRVAAGRDDAEGARAWFVRALEIDPQEAAARRLLTALERELAAPQPAPAPDAAPAPEAPVPAPAVGSAPAVEPVQAAGPAPAGEPIPGPAPSPETARAPARRSILDRIRGWLGLAARR
jgi:hypothetical protein